MLRTHILLCWDRRRAFKLFPPISNEKVGEISNHSLATPNTSEIKGLLTWSRWLFASYFQSFDLCLFSTRIFFIIPLLLVSIMLETWRRSKTSQRPKRQLQLGIVEILLKLCWLFCCYRWGENMWPTFTVYSNSSIRFSVYLFWAFAV